LRHGSPRYCGTSPCTREAAGAEPRPDIVDGYFEHVRGTLGVETIPGNAIEALRSRCGPELHSFFVVPRDSAALLLAQEAALA
jgi:hypothetical protein